MHLACLKDEDTYLPFSFIVCISKDPCIKVNGCIFTGTTAIFIRAFLLNGHQLLIREFAFRGVNSFFFGVDSISEGLCYPGKETVSHKSCLPLKTGGVPIPLKRQIRLYPDEC